MLKVALVLLTAGVAAAFLGFTGTMGPASEIVRIGYWVITGLFTISLVLGLTVRP